MGSRGGNPAPQTAPRSVEDGGEMSDTEKSETGLPDTPAAVEASAPPKNGG